MSLPDRFLAIDEEGYPLFGDIRVTDPLVGRQILSQMQLAENGAVITQAGDVAAVVEAFDDPLVAQMIDAPAKGFDKWSALFPFDVRFPFSLESLRLDEWDRFHGRTEAGLSFVMSRKAQAAFFDSLEEFDDDSITFRGRTYPAVPWLSSVATPELQGSEFWSKIYQTETPGWELNSPAPPLAEMLPRMKIPKSRVLILGCGSGNDAALFAQQGHVVTGVDFSADAIAQAKQKYGSLENLRLVQNDIFTLDSSWNQQYDLVFEHTCYCAIAPEKRNDLIATWRRLLIPQGQLMGIFFVTEKPNGPPFGGTEWELRERLKKYFQFTFWGRWRQSTDRRQGKELFVFAQQNART